MEELSCIISKRTKDKLPRLSFVSIKNTILGKEYYFELSFISSKKQKELNSKFRGINKTTNILSFPLSEKSGEITIDLKKVKKDAPLFDMSYSQFLKLLVIHGMLHLKGFDHGAIMEKQEKKFLKKFS
jgi:probable rRNA maturation factor